MIESKVFVTTTPSKENWDIEAYLGPVFSHIVAGTGFFSDFAASLSDIFGGRSEFYQRQLCAINDEAIALLKRKTSLIGGNLILGLRIDHDEISGKAKQIFMVSASGTAVRGTSKSSPSDDRPGRSGANPPPTPGSHSHPALFLHQIRRVIAGGPPARRVTTPQSCSQTKVYGRQLGCTRDATSEPDTC